ncbi:glycosyltransferase family protein [Hymenobacter tenuis]|jgi:4-amino-4-deoxy-L-arabinose transferase
MRSLKAAANQLPASWWLGLLLLSLAIAFAVGLNAWGLLESSEARYAEIGREMLASSDWLHPRLLGIQHFHKPPLTYWLTAVGLAITGPTAAGVRLLPGVAVLLQILLVYSLGKLFFEGDARRALTAAVVYGTLPVVWVAALNATTDVYLATWELAAAYGILHHYHRHSRWGLYLFWLGLGLAFLTKGPVGLVLPLMAVASFYFRQGQARRRFTVHHALGAGLFVAVGLSWYLFLVAENPAFLHYFLVGHTVERFANSEAFGRAKPWWFYVVLAPVTSLPWSALLVGRGARVGWAALPRPWKNVLLFWVLIPVLFFSLSQSKLLLYVLPVFAGVALLTAYHLHALSAAALARWSTCLLAFWGVVLLLIAAPWVAHVAHLTVPVSTTWVAGLGLLGVAFLGLDHQRLEPKARLLGGAAVFMAALLLAVKPLLQANELAFNGTRPLAAALQSAGLAGRPVLVYDQLVPSLAFALERIPLSLYGNNQSLRRETQFESDSHWHTTWLSLNDSSPAALDSVLRQHPVLLVKGEVNEAHRWIAQRLTQRLDVGPWHVYYEQ